jgi:hypothetical protein
VQIILAEAKAFKPHVWLNVHSGMYALFTPYDHKATVGPGAWEAAPLRGTSGEAKRSRWHSRHSRAARSGSLPLPARAPRPPFPPAATPPPPVSHPPPPAPGPQVPNGPDAAAAVRMMGRINEVSCDKKCAVGSGGKSVGCVATHTLPRQRALGRLQRPLALCSAAGDAGLGQPRLGLSARAACHHGNLRPRVPARPPHPPPPRPAPPRPARPRPAPLCPALLSYLAHGTATDYMYEVLKVPLSFTWEIFGDASASFEDCFKMFNPVTPEVFKVGGGAGARARPTPRQSIAGSTLVAQTRGATTRGGWLCANQ